MIKLIFVTLFLTSFLNANTYIIKTSLSTLFEQIGILHKKVDSLTNIVEELSSTAIKNSNQLYVKTWFLKARKDKSLNSKVVNIYKIGTILKYTKEENGWYLLNNGEYISSKMNLTKKIESSIIFTNNSTYTKNIRKTPQIKKNNIVGKLAPSSIIILIGKVSNNWYLTLNGHFIHIRNLSTGV